MDKKRRQLWCGELAMTIAEVIWFAGIRLAVIEYQSLMNHPYPVMSWLMVMSLSVSDMTSCLEYEFPVVLELVVTTTDQRFSDASDQS